MKTSTKARGSLKLADLRPGNAYWEVDCDDLVDAIYFGKDLPGLFDENAFFRARLFLEGIVAAYAHGVAPAERNLASVSELITGTSLFLFCREAAKLREPYIRARLIGFAQPEAEDSGALTAIQNTAALLLKSHLRARDRQPA